MNFKKSLLIMLASITGVVLLHAGNRAHANRTQQAKQNRCVCTCSCGYRDRDAHDQFVEGNVRGRKVMFCDREHKQNFPTYCPNGIEGDAQ